MIRKYTLKGIMGNRFAALLLNMLLAIALLMLARIIFIAYNYNEFYKGFLSASLLWDMLRGGFRFDLSALFYINALYLVLYLFPLHYKESKIYHRILKYVYVTFNGAALAANLADCVYVRFTGRRTTATVFSEFANEGNIAKIVSTELFGNIPLVIVFIAVIWLVAKLYRTPALSQKSYTWRYYIASTAALLVTAVTALGCIRGGIDRTTRPITLSNANQYVNRPIEAAAVLNTPFSIIRSAGKTSFNLPPYMDADAAAAIYSPMHYPADSAVFKPKNVVIFIVESFSRGFVGALNKDQDSGNFKGYTPFTDSLIDSSLTYTHSYANGMKSIDGMPSVLSSIPMMIEPFFLTPAALNDMGGIAHALKQKGYYSAFFHGAPNGSMGFEAFARRSGFDDYFGLNEYGESHDATADFDGSWAIWDEPFFQYFAEEMSTFKEPFVAAMFSASSHHPFALPEQYRDTFPEEGDHPLLKCIRYTDHALRRFFDTARTQPWFDNTLFIITSDHSAHPTAPVHATPMGRFASPIIFYAPGDTALRGYDTERLAQQIDIMPTALSYLGYDKPYVAFGIDLLNTAPEDTWTFSYSAGTYQYALGDYFIEFDGEKPTAAYNFRKDPELKQNLLPRDMPQQELDALVAHLKAFIQQYASAMRTNKLLPEKYDMK